MFRQFINRAKYNITSLLLGVNILLGLCGSCFTETRNITFSVNHGCKNDCLKPWLIYGKGENINDTLHYLWSAVQLPSYVIVSSSPDSIIEIDWDGLQKGKAGSVSFSSPPDSVFGISFQSLILFNDKNDTGRLDGIPEADRQNVPLSDFEWDFEPLENISSSEVAVTFHSTSYLGVPLENGTEISFSVTAYGTEGRSSHLPHLITTPDSVQMKVALDNLVLDLKNNTIFNNGHQYRHTPKDKVVPISGFDSPRWAFDTIIFSSDNPEGSGTRFNFHNKKSLDDEYTPGVFDLDSISTPSSSQGIQTLIGGFMQWRPVCYLTTDENVNDSTYPNFNTSLPSVDESHFDATKQSLVYVLFGNNFKNLLSTQTTIAFGLTEDQFYTQHNYTVWTFSMGLGPVPDEKFSSILIIVISVGVGIPLLLFLVGGVFLGIRKLRTPKDDEALLEG